MFLLSIPLKPYWNSSSQMELLAKAHSHLIKTSVQGMFRAWVNDMLEQRAKYKRAAEHYLRIFLMNAPERYFKKWYKYLLQRRRWHLATAMGYRVRSKRIMSRWQYFTEYSKAMKIKMR